MAQLSKQLNHPNAFSVSDGHSVINFRDPEAGDGFDKSEVQNGIFIHGNEGYTVYASLDGGTTWQTIVYVDPSDSTFEEGFTMSWDDYDKIAFKASHDAQTVRVVGLDGPILVDTTDDGVYNPDSVVIDSSAPISILFTGNEAESEDEAGGTATIVDYSNANQSTFLGTSAGENQQTPAVNPVTGAAIESENIGVGYQALQDTTTGTNNVAIGSNSLSENTTGFNNVAISKGALGDYLLNNTTIGIGFDAGKPIENGAAIDGHIGNTLMGHETFNAFNVKDTAEISNNTAIGLRALKGIGGTDTASPKLNNVKNNTAIGRQAGNGIVHTSGGALNHNTFLGNSAGMNAVPQQGNMMSNLLLGARAGMGGYIGSNNVILQNATADTTLGNANWGVSGNIAIGGNAAVYSDNNVVIGNGADSAPNTIGTSDIDDETKGENQSGNMILAGSGNTISNIGGKKVQNNSILSGTNVTVGGSSESKDNFLANVKGVTLNGTRNVILSSELDSEDASQSIYCRNSTIINSTSFALSSNTQLNTIVSSQNITISESQGRMGAYNSSQIDFSGGQEHVAIRSFGSSFIGGQKTVALRDQSSSIKGTNMVLINTSSITCDGRDVTFIGGSNHNNANGAEDNIYIGGSSASTVANADNNILLGVTSTSNIGGSNNLISGTGHTAIGEKVKWSFIAGSQHTLSPAANAQRNIVVGYQNTVTAGNNSFIGGTKGDINESNSFGYGKGIQLEHGNMAGFGKFNDGAANDEADALFTVGCGFNENAGRRNAMNVVSATVDGNNNKAVVYLDQLVDFNFTDDADAAAKGIGVGGLYHTDGVVKIRLV